MTIREAMIINAASVSAYKETPADTIDWIDDLIKAGGLDPDKDVWLYTCSEVKMHD